jgi:hypothetical protein
MMSTQRMADLYFALDDTLSLLFGGNQSTADLQPRNQLKLSVFGGMTSTVFLT